MDRFLTGIGKDHAINFEVVPKTIGLAALAKPLHSGPSHLTAICLLQEAPATDRRS